MKESDGTIHDLYFEHGPRMEASHLESEEREFIRGDTSYFVDNEIPVDKTAEGKYEDPHSGEVYSEI